MEASNDFIFDAGDNPLEKDYSLLGIIKEFMTETRCHGFNRYRVAQGNFNLDLNCAHLYNSLFAMEVGLRRVCGLRPFSVGLWS